MHSLAWNNELCTSILVTSSYEHQFEPEDMPGDRGLPFLDLLERLSTPRHGIARHRAGRTLHKTCGLTAICAPQTIRLSCCSDKLLQVTLVCACGLKMYQNASPTLPVKPIGWKWDASEGAYGIPHYVWNRAVREDGLILTIILKALDAQQGGSVTKHN